MGSNKPIERLEQPTIYITKQNRATHTYLDQCVPGGGEVAVVPQQERPGRGPGEGYGAPVRVNLLLFKKKTEF